MSDKKIESYKKLIKEIKRVEGAIADQNYTSDLVRELERRIKMQEVRNLFGIQELPESSDANFIRIREWEKSIFYANTEKPISWPDDGRQPKDEYLYQIRFPTGAYIFGSHYLTELFNRFWNELKTYNPKYIDTTNNCLYFSPENAAEIHYTYDEIYKKYKDQASDEQKKMKKEELKRELAKLEE